MPTNPIGLAHVVLLGTLARMTTSWSGSRSSHHPQQPMPCGQSGRLCRSPLPCGPPARAEGPV